MKKKALLLVLCAVLLLTGCTAISPSDGDDYQRDPLTVYPTQIPEEDYDPLAEEDGTGFNPSAVYDEYGNIVYAGATPISLDPVDMPTATPRPTLSFTYTGVQSDKLGIKFDAPVNWQMNASALDTIILRDTQSYDNVTATVTIQMVSVEASFKASDAKTRLSKLLDETSHAYVNWEINKAADTTMAGKNGYYNNYRGVEADGTVVRGRIYTVLLSSGKLMVVHLVAPGWYNSSYTAVVNRFKESVAIYP